ncbi:hypothetical protein D3C81_1003710 [compost metagenome]
MLDQLKKMGYPAKIYLYVFLFIATVIGMKYVVETTLPEGGRPPYLFLIWNTFLAWIPVGLAVMLDLISASARIRSFKMIMLLGIGLLWLFFYPNAAYLLTDLLHPFHRYPLESAFWLENSFWNHLFTVLFTALLGLILGNVSLASVHGLVGQSLGKIAGWAFVVIVLLLSSFGVYLGRFMRWNSWDLLQEPLHVLKETLLYFTDLTNVMHAVSFCKWIFLITFFSYVAMYMFRTINDHNKSAKGAQIESGE